MDKEFETALQMAYGWLEEGRPLEQCDLKNFRAISGLDTLEKYNKTTNETTTRPAPLDEFVAEQIRRVPQELIERAFKKEPDLKWVNGERIADFDSTLAEIYG
jgi:hypothetical protein